MNSQGTIFAGTDGWGVYRSTNDGNNWSAVNQGLTNSYVWSVLALPTGSVLAGTLGSGVFVGIPVSLPAGPVATVSSKMLVLSGAVRIGQFKDTTISIANTGTDTLKISSIVSSSPVYTLRVASGTLLPNQSLTDTIRFAPVSVGGAAGVIVMTSNSPTSPDTVKITGEGMASTTGIIEGGLPGTFDLSQNYPSPFNPSTTIRYALPKTANVSLKVFNALGQVMAILVEAEKEAGYYEVHWSPTDAPSGVYFYRLQAGEFAETKRMILVK